MFIDISGMLEARLYPRNLQSLNTTSFIHKISKLNRPLVRIVLLPSWHYPSDGLSNSLDCKYDLKTKMKNIQIAEQKIAAARNQCIGTLSCVLFFDDLLTENRFLVHTLA